MDVKKLWVLVQKDDGKRKTYTSWDGPPSPAYTPYVPLIELDKIRKELEELKAQTVSNL